MMESSNVSPTPKAMVPAEFLGELLLNEEFSDVRVNVENELEMFDFPAHNFVLMRRSPVLKRMLESDFLEGQNPKTIVIKDFKAVHVENFLKFMYTDALPEHEHDLCKLVKMADKYLVQELKDSSEKSLIACLNLSNVYKLCNLACLYSLGQLRISCRNLIKKAAFKLLKEDDFKCLSKEMMKEIVTAADLNVKEEVDVFWAIWRWGNLQLRYKGVAFSNDNVFKLIEDILPGIRWSEVDKADLQKIQDLGVTLPSNQMVPGAGDSDSEEEEERDPSLSDVDLPWFLNQCDSLCIDKFASSCTFLPKYFKPSSSDDVLLEAVSANDSPFYLVGVLFAVTKLTAYKTVQLYCYSSANYKYVKGELSSFNVENILTMTRTSASVDPVEYHEVLCEFSNPILFRKHWPLKISVRGLPQCGSIHMKMNGKLVKSNKKREIFVRGDVYGVKKLFLL